MKRAIKFYLAVAAVFFIAACSLFYPQGFYDRFVAQKGKLILHVRNFSDYTTNYRVVYWDGDCGDSEMPVYSNPDGMWTTVELDGTYTTFKVVYTGNTNLSSNDVFMNSPDFTASNETWVEFIKGEGTVYYTPPLEASTYQEQLYTIYFKRPDDWPNEGVRLINDDQSYNAVMYENPKSWFYWNTSTYFAGSNDFEPQSTANPSASFYDDGFSNQLWCVAASYWETSTNRPSEFCNVSSNLTVYNGSFESGLDGWYVSNADVYSTQTHHSDGSSCIELAVITSGMTASLWMQPAQFIPVEQDMIYYVSYTAWGDGASYNEVYIHCAWYDDTGTYIGESASTNHEIFDSNNFYVFSDPFEKIPEKATSMQIGIEAYSVADGGAVYVDNVQVEQLWYEPY